MPDLAKAVRDQRGEPRDEVMHRTHATDAAGGITKLVIVNVSARGFMARCERNPDAGDRLKIALPVLGDVGAVVRWSLGGRIGCELDHMLPLADYYGMLAVMTRNI